MSGARCRVCQVQVPGARCRCQVPGARCQVPGARCQARCQVPVLGCQVPGASSRCRLPVGPLGGVAGAAGPIPGVRWSVVSGQWSLVGGDYPASNLYSFSFVVASVLSRWFAMFRNRRRPMIGMPTHSQHPRRDRPRRHKGIDVSHPRCIMVSSRKHHRSVCGTDRTGAGIMLSEPTPRRGWRDAFGNRGGGGWGRARRRGPIGRFSRSRSPKACPVPWSARPEYL